MRSLAEVIGGSLPELSSFDMSQMIETAKADEEERWKSEVSRLQKRCDAENLAEGTLNETDGHNCAKCKNKGYIVKVKTDYGYPEQVQVTCGCMKARRSIRNLENSGLKHVLTDFTFEKFKATEPWQTTMLNTARLFVEGVIKNKEQAWLFIGGQSGSGKTHLCSAAAIDLLRREYELLYIKWREAVREIRNASDSNLIDKYKNVEVLYIDDLFKTGKAEGQKSQKPYVTDINIAFEIISSRAFARKITIISSESDIYELFDIDEAVAGRIKQMCGKYIVRIGKDTKKNYRRDKL